MNLALQLAAQDIIAEALGIEPFLVIDSMHYEPLPLPPFGQGRERVKAYNRGLHKYRAGYNQGRRS